MIAKTQPFYMNGTIRPSAIQSEMTAENEAFLAQIELRLPSVDPGFDVLRIPIYGRLKTPIRCNVYKPERWKWKASINQQQSHRDRNLLVAASSMLDRRSYVNRHRKEKFQDFLGDVAPACLLAVKFQTVIPGHILNVAIVLAGHRVKQFCNDFNVYVSGLNEKSVHVDPPPVWYLVEYIDAASRRFVYKRRIFFRAWTGAAGENGIHRCRCCYQLPTCTRNRSISNS
jgi:hypothetical protein